MAMLIYQRVITMLKFHTVFQGGEISHQNETNISYQHVYIIKIYLYIYIYFEKTDQSNTIQYSNTRISSQDKSTKVSVIKNAGTEPIRLFWGVGFPLVYISRIHTTSIGEYLHFRYLKQLVNKTSINKLLLRP